MCLYKEETNRKILVLYHLRAYSRLRHQNLTVFKPCVMGKRFHNYLCTKLIFKDVGEGDSALDGES